ncbi:hypothetical protein WR25_24142 [Diploscapter pachys]|uniref:FMN hydroxy acid dehydrogenase domain-containing protein n=1 Tax=Diploscapter pachys TaxID=2018661 RepID=A0A2A2K1T5_9BILA|nr:hypothetical protein WR25_24142 [Diploscapter pachys]
MAHPQGELATIRGASQAGALMILSSWSTTAVGEVTNEASRYGGHVWFQLYVYRDREITKYLIEQAEKAGVKALVLTVDTPVLGRRLTDQRNNFKLPEHLGFANIPKSDKRQQMEEVEQGHSGLLDYVKHQIDPSLSWETLKWIKTKTSLPIVVKGVMRPEDALLAIEHGASGIIVSNHGGRQMDSTAATIEVLPSIIRAVNKKIPVFVDGGIRSGQDALKAVALGATGVFIGRPILWALSVEGASGVKRALNIMQQEFTEGMRLVGCRSIKELQEDKNLIVHENNVHKL